MATKEKKRLVLNIDVEVYEKFKKLAEKQNRAVSNLGTTLIKEYVEKNYKE